MALPKVEVEITADTKRAEAGFDRVEKGMAGVGAAADRASSRTDRLGTTLNRNTGRSSAFGRGIQNASFQLGDFATQVGAGTSASIALGQQLPQLLGGFGIMGAVLGAVVAVAVPLARAFQGLAGDSENLERALGTLSPAAGAIADAFQRLRDMGVQMAEIIINNLDRILITAGAVATFFAVKWVAAFAKARIATITLKGAFNGLKAAMLRFLPTAVFIAIGELIFQFSRLVKAAGGMGKALGLIGDVFVEVWDRMKQGVSLLGEMFEGVGMLITGAFQSAFGAVATAFNDYVMTPIVKGFNTLIDAANSFGANFTRLEMPSLGEGISDEGQYNMEGGRAVIGSAAGSLGEALTAPFQSVQKIRDLLAGMKEEGLSLPDILGVGGGEEGAGGGGGGGGGGQDRDASPLVQGLANAREQLEMWYAEMKEMLESASEDELSAIGGYNEAKLRLEEEYQRRLKQIKQQGASAEIQTVIGAGQQILQAMGQTNKKALQIAAAFGAAKALVNTMEGASKELAKGGLAGIAKAAAVIAAGMSFVNSIRSIGSSGATGGAMVAGASAAGVAGSTAPAAPAQPEVSRSVAIRLEGGDMFSRDQVLRLINEINESIEDGAVIRLA